MCEPTLNLSLALHYSFVDGVTVVYNKIYSDHPPVNPLYSESEILCEFDKMLRENSHLFVGQKTTRLRSQQLVYTITFIKPVIFPLHNMKRINGKIIIVSADTVLLSIKTTTPKTAAPNKIESFFGSIFFAVQRVLVQQLPFFPPLHLFYCLLICVLFFFYLFK
ncbi:protein ORF56 [Lake sturgeon herpesvirus]|nr:protein ORF56 [Lake sturgeon herpesvirus]